MNKMLENMRGRKKIFVILILVCFFVGLFLSFHVIHAVTIDNDFLEKNGIKYGKTDPYNQLYEYNNTYYRVKYNQNYSPDGVGDYTTVPVNKDGSEIKDAPVVVSSPNIGTVTVADGKITKADDNKPGLGAIIGNLVGWVLYMIAVAAGWIVSALVYAMLSVMSYPINTHLEAITSGWMAIRDLCNNFFIVILIAIAIGTIIKIPQWQIKELLPKLLVMAILINFSKMFCGLMIDASQIMMLAFAAPLQGITGGNIILSALGIPDMYTLMDPGNTGDYVNTGAGTLNENTGVGFLNIITALIYALIASVIAAAVMMAIISILVYRIVVLLFLTVLSPLPFLLTTFKKGEQYASQWWTEMTKNLVVGPIMLFFLWISFVIMGYSSQATNVQKYDKLGATGKSSGEVANLTIKGNNRQAPDLINTSSAQFTVLSHAMSTEGIINFALVIGMLIASLVMGQKSGAVGASAAGKSLSFLDKARKGAQAMPWRAAKTVGTGIDDKFGIRDTLAKAGFAVTNRVPLVRGFISRPFAAMSAKRIAETEKRQQSAKANISVMKDSRNMSAEAVAKDMNSKNKDVAMAAAETWLNYYAVSPLIDNTLRKNTNSQLKNIIDGGGNREMINKLKDNVFRHEAVSLDLFGDTEEGREELRRAAMNGKYNTDKAIRKSDSTKRTQAFFDTFASTEDIEAYKKMDYRDENGNYESADGKKKYTEEEYKKLNPDEKDKLRKGRKMDINSFATYSYNDHDGDPKAIAATISQFQNENVKQYVRKGLDLEKLQPLLRNGDTGLIDKDNTSAILGSLIQNRLMPIENFSKFFLDKDGNMSEENRDIMEEVVNKNGSEIARSSHEGVARVQQLRKQARDPKNSAKASDLLKQADDLEEKIKAQQKDLVTHISAKTGGAIFNTLRGGKDEEKDLTRDAVTEALVDKLDAIFDFEDKYVEEYKKTHTGATDDEALKELERIEEAGKSEQGYASLTEEQKKTRDSYKVVTGDAALSAEHCYQGSVKTNLVGVMRKSAEGKQSGRDKKRIRKTVNKNMRKIISVQSMSNIQKGKVDGAIDGDNAYNLAVGFIENWSANQTQTFFDNFDKYDKKVSKPIEDLLTQIYKIEQEGGGSEKYQKLIDDYEKRDVDITQATIARAKEALGNDKVAGYIKKSSGQVNTTPPPAPPPPPPPAPPSPAQVSNDNAKNNKKEGNRAERRAQDNARKKNRK